MAAELDLSEAPAGDRRAPLWPVLALLGAAVAAALAAGAPGLYLLAAGLAGFGLTYLLGMPLAFEERAFFGAVAGAMVTAALTFGCAFAFGLRASTVWAGCLLGLAAGAAGWWLGRERLAPDARDLAARWSRPWRSAGHPWPLAAVLLPAWLYVLRLAPQLYVYQGGGLLAGTLGVWGDWAAHLAYAGSFAYGDNFPPQFPIDPGHPLGYPFMVDFLSASLVPLGASLTSSLVWVSALLGLVFPGVMYLAAVRLTGRRAAAAAAVFVFCLQGGLGFYYFFVDLGRSGPAVLDHLPREYTHIPADNLQWLNPVLANLLPQRSTLVGFAFLLLTLALLFTARALPHGSWRPFLALGVMTGLAPAFHVHSYGTVVVLAAFWAAITPRKEWLAYFLPAVLLALPVLAFLAPPAHPCDPASGARCLGPVTLLPGWLAQADGHHDFIPWFWLMNLGLFIPLLLAAQFWPQLLPNGFGRHFAPVWLWFLIPNLVQLHVWDWDNNKFLVLWSLLGSLLVGALLAHLAGLGRGMVVPVAALLLGLGLAGGLDLARALDSKVSSEPFTDAGGLRVAAWARESTAPHDVFLTSTNHNQPIPSLGGRRVVMGYTGWVWSYGLTDWSQREADVGAMLQGQPQTAALLHRYDVRWVVIGPQERALGASDAYWARHGRLMYDQDGYRVYEVLAG